MNNLFLEAVAFSVILIVIFVAVGGGHGFPLSTFDEKYACTKYLDDFACSQAEHAYVKEIVNFILAISLGVNLAFAKNLVMKK